MKLLGKRKGTNEERTEEGKEEEKEVNEDEKEKVKEIEVDNKRTKLGKMEA